MCLKCGVTIGSRVSRGQRYPLAHKDAEDLRKWCEGSTAPVPETPAEPSPEAKGAGAACDGPVGKVTRLPLERVVCTACGQTVVGGVHDEAGRVFPQRHSDRVGDLCPGERIPGKLVTTPMVGPPVHDE